MARAPAWLRGTVAAAALCLVGCQDLVVVYSDHQNLASLDWAMKWYAEDTSGALMGPADSRGSGVVWVGPLAAGPIHVSRTLLPEFIFTQMDVPERLIHYYTGSQGPSLGYVTVALDNATLGHELLLFYPFVNWWTLDANPYSLTQSFSGEDVVDNDGEVSVFVSVRSDETEEPTSRYDFRLGLDLASLSDVRFDAGGLRTRSPVRSWQSSADLSGDRPHLVAQRKGVHLIVGESSIDFAGTSGEFGVPGDFPAERWYLVSGSGTSDIVKAFDPAGSGPVPLEPVGGFVDDQTLAFDAGERRFSASAPGLGAVDFGVLLLTHAGGYWEVSFPATRLEWAGDVLSLSLPRYPKGALPSFDSVRLWLYRLDDGATPLDMHRYLWFRRAHPLPSHAMLREFRFL